MEIRNKNFICKKMLARDIKEAFVISGQIVEFIYKDLIENGYITKAGDRYFIPTEKLLNEVFLPKILKVTVYQIRYLSLNSYFYKGDLIQSFGGTLEAEQVIKKLIADGYFILDDSKRFRKSVELENFLAEGEDTFYWGGETV